MFSNFSEQVSHDSDEELLSGVRGKVKLPPGVAAQEDLEEEQEQQLGVADTYADYVPAKC